MGRYQSPLVKHDLSKLEDAQGRDTALTSLRSCVRQLEPESIAFFLDQIAEAHQQDASRPYVISLYEDVARAHRALLVPYIPRIMETVVSALAESGSSVRVHEACAKVVAAVSVHCIDLDRLNHQAKEVLRLLVEPLLCVLVSKFEPLGAGAAVCLEALVLSSNWVQAPGELVNELCSRLAAAIAGKSSRTLAHVQLACTIAKVNRNVLARYGRDLLRSGVEILQTSASSSWTLRVGAAQLLEAVIGLVDGALLGPEIDSVIEVLDRYRLDRMRKVRLAVAEALKAARAARPGNVGPQVVLSTGADRKKTSKSPGSPSSCTGSTARNVYGMNNRRLPTSSSGRSSSSGVRPHPFASMRSDRQMVKPNSSAEFLAFDFVLMEPEYEDGYRNQHRIAKQNPGCGRGRHSANTPGIRHTISAEPGGYVIQEWIRVDNSFPPRGKLSGIDEGPEHDQEAQFYPQTDTSAAGQSRLLEEIDCTSVSVLELEDVKPAAEQTNDELKPPAEDRNPELKDPAEWSVRANPIASNPESLSETPPETPPDADSSSGGCDAPRTIDDTARDDEDGADSDRLEASVCDDAMNSGLMGGESSEELAAVSKSALTEEQQQQQKLSEQQQRPLEEEQEAGSSNRDDSEQQQQQQQEAWVDVEAQQQEELPVELDQRSPEEEDLDPGREQEIKRKKWFGLVRKGLYGLQCGVEGLLAMSACAMVAVPLAMAFIKCLEPSSPSSDFYSHYNYPYYYINNGSAVPT